MNIALLGYGVVGRSIDEILLSSARDMTVSKILVRRDAERDSRMTLSYDEIINDPDIDVVVECMGGMDPAYNCIIRALTSGKSVVTSNKVVVADHLVEFVHLSHEHHTAFRFEASVAGGIPWLVNLARSRRVNTLTAIQGIMNGTSNFILDQMTREQLTFDEALLQAQERGYAEADPTADVEGFDVLNKLRISSAVAWDISCPVDIPRASLTKVTPEDIHFFSEQDLCVKYLARAATRNGSFAAAIELVACKKSSMEAQTPQNYNLVSLSGSEIGTLAFFGQGAGGRPTAEAVIQDIVDLSSNLYNTEELLPCMLDWNLLRSNYYVVTTEDLSDIAEKISERRYVWNQKTPEEVDVLLKRLSQYDTSAHAFCVI